jgi:hypothetical protein
MSSLAAVLDTAFVQDVLNGAVPVASLPLDRINACFAHMWAGCRGDAALQAELFATLREGLGPEWPKGARSASGESPLYDALRAGTVGFAEMLLEMGAWVRVEDG